MNIYEKYPLPWRVETEKKTKYDENTGEPFDCSFHWVRAANGNAPVLFLGSEEPIAHAIVAGSQALLQIETLKASMKSEGVA